MTIALYLDDVLLADNDTAEINCMKREFANRSRHEISRLIVETCTSEA